jgi:hypothetical protein
MVVNDSDQKRDHNQTNDQNRQKKQKNRLVVKILRLVSFLRRVDASIHDPLPFIEHKYTENSIHPRENIIKVI